MSEKCHESGIILIHVLYNVISCNAHLLKLINVFCSLLSLSCFQNTFHALRRKCEPVLYVYLACLAAAK
jgi:hypothetical protein